ncbi:ribonucleases P/MRP protein subunit POP1-domain-containing protein, partial [Microdochium trichocladiopsis]
RPTIRDVRAIAVSKADPAVQDGQLNVQSFIDARSFELKALTESMRRTKASSTSRAFQIVPITLRRRTAAHNHKRVPKRLQPRAKREMVQDNTPTVNSKTRKPGSTRNRLRAENARRLGLLAKRKKLLKSEKPGLDKKTLSLRAARPKIRRNTLNDPVVTNRKFRRRQINKTWLPTHLWHTKRARMTEPSKPLWRFAIPLTPSNKSYRPTHRAQFDRGALAWDMSYISTIGLAGRLSGVRNVLKAIGLNHDRLWDDRGERWRAGAVHWTGLLKKQVAGAATVIAPATVIWNPVGPSESGDDDMEKQQRRLFIRVHPSAFFDTFDELLRLARTNNPRPYVEDLRYEIGAIDLVGPSSTEALMAILKPHAEDTAKSLGEKFQTLFGLKDPASLPLGSMFAFSAADPRLRYPFLPRRHITTTAEGDAQARNKLYEVLSTFHKEPAGGAMALFDRDARFKASRLPSQKSINRRKSKGAPGAPLKTTPEDPAIPVIVLASRHPTDPQAPGVWSVLLPWKCVLPFWYCLMHYPLSTGGNPQFGGLDELRQLSFERGLPWFPGDVPGTKAGNAWELEQRDLRLKKWQRMPKGKRHNYETLNLGGGRKGEIGPGWSCAFELLFPGNGADEIPGNSATAELDVDMEDAEPKAAGPVSVPSNDNPLGKLSFLPKLAFNTLLQQDSGMQISTGNLVTIKIRMITKGTPLACARIYRLPTDFKRLEATLDQESAMDADGPVSKPGSADVPASFPVSDQQQSFSKAIPAGQLHEQWLSLLPNHNRKKPYPNENNNFNGAAATTVAKASRQRPLTVEDRQRLIAQQLTAPLAASPASAARSAGTGQPICPDAHDLIGFVTKGEFNLRDGRGEGIGSLSAVLAAEELRRYATAGGGRGAAGLGDIASRLCVVRNVGEDVGRLARWELV